MTTNKKTNNAKAEPMIYYDIEVSQPTFDAIKRAANIIYNLQRGDLSPVVGYALDAYRQRTGEDAPADVEHNIRECARGLAAWGWNRPLEDGAPAGDADIYLDISNVLGLQAEIINGLPISEDFEIKHHAADVPLPRVRCAYQSTQARKKQLRVFADKISNRKPR